MSRRSRPRSADRLGRHRGGTTALSSRHRDHRFSLASTNDAHSSDHADHATARTQRTPRARPCGVTTSSAFHEEGVRPSPGRPQLMEHARAGGCSPESSSSLNDPALVASNRAWKTGEFSTRFYPRPRRSARGAGLRDQRCPRRPQMRRAASAQAEQRSLSAMNARRRARTPPPALRSGRLVETRSRPGELTRPSKIGIKGRKHVEAHPARRGWAKATGLDRRQPKTKRRRRAAGDGVPMLARFPAGQQSIERRACSRLQPGVALGEFSLSCLHRLQSCGLVRGDMATGLASISAGRLNEAAKSAEMPARSALQFRAGPDERWAETVGAEVYQQMEELVTLVKTTQLEIQVPASRSTPFLSSPRVRRLACT